MGSSNSKNDQFDLSSGLVTQRSGTSISEIHSSAYERWSKFGLSLTALVVPLMTVLLTLVPPNIGSEKEFYDQGTGITIAFWMLIVVGMFKVRGVVCNFGVCNEDRLDYATLLPLTQSLNLADELFHSEAYSRLGPRIPRQRAPHSKHPDPMDGRYLEEPLEGLRVRQCQPYFLRRLRYRALPGAEDYRGHGTGAADVLHDEELLGASGEPPLASEASRKMDSFGAFSFVSCRCTSNGQCTTKKLTCEYVRFSRLEVRGKLLI